MVYSQLFNRIDEDVSSLVEKVAPSNHKYIYASNLSRSSRNGRSRKSYMMFTAEFKKLVVETAKEFGVKEAARRHNAPIKSIKRWMVGKQIPNIFSVGIERQKGGGRKTKDPNMEMRLYEWYLDRVKDGATVTSQMIKEKAIQFTDKSDFIASKGWLDKFRNRYDIQLHKRRSK